MSLSTLLNNFHNAILENDAAPAIPDIKPSARITPAAQLAIYIDGYRIRLTAAIRSDYPETLGLLGDAEFDKLALEYIENNPPTSFNLDRYPHNFAGFISDKTDDLKAEIALLESAIAEVFMLPESAPFSAFELAKLAPENIASIILEPRKASKLLAFKYDVNEWLNAQRIKNNLNSSILDSSIPGSTFLYIYRHENNVQRTPLSHPEYIVLQQIFSGSPLENALETAANLHPEYEVTIATNMQEWFSKWTLSGFFANLPQKLE